MDTNSDSFEQLLHRLEPNLVDSAARYRQFRLKLIKFFQWKRCNDAEALADETIARAITKINEGHEIESDNPYVYVFAIAKHVYHEYVRKEIKERALLDNFPLPPSEPTELDDCRTQCLQKISSDKLKLLQEYFLDEKSGQQLAKERNTTLNGLRLQIYRLRKELEACYEDCRKQQKNRI